MCLIEKLRGYVPFNIFSRFSNFHSDAEKRVVVARGPYSLVSIVVEHNGLSKHHNAVSCSQSSNIIIPLFSPTFYHYNALSYKQAPFYELQMEEAAAAAATVSDRRSIFMRWPYHVTSHSPSLAAATVCACCRLSMTTKNNTVDDQRKIVAQAGWNGSRLASAAIISVSEICDRPTTSNRCRGV